VLLRCDEASVEAATAAAVKPKRGVPRGPPPETVRPTPPRPKQSTVMGVVPMLLNCLHGLSSLRLFVEKDLRPREARETMGRQLSEVLRRFPDGLPVLDPLEDLKIRDDDYTRLVRKLETAEDRLTKQHWHKALTLPVEFAKFEKRTALEAQIATLRAEIHNASGDVVMRQTLNNMKRVLRRLGFTTADGVIDLKGRVACEISTCDELLGKGTGLLSLRSSSGSVY
jgi:ATP-dependent RNA helicase DOB1